MISKFISLIIIFLCFNGFSNAATKDDEKAIETIVNAQYYSWGLVGTPAKISENEFAIRQLNKKSKILLLIKNYQKASTEGRIYILCAVNYLNKDDFEKLLKLKLIDENSYATTLTGDILKKEPTEDIIQQIRLNNCDPLKWKINKLK